MKKRKWLTGFRLASGKTFKELSKEIGVTPQFLYYLETGERTPSTKLAKKIAKILGFEWTKFYEEQED